MGTIAIPEVTQQHRLVFVQPGVGERWEVIMEGRVKSVQFTDRETALSYAHIWAAVNRPSTVLLYGEASGVQGEWRFDTTRRLSA